ncbi:hypothetical protein EVA_11971 [gut metagenome]|uniref:Uncharacterized protein n=1 Tax=gut metagenome TaxID=749906 RepID=J9GDQ6_9ZZZZ
MIISDGIRTVDELFLQGIYDIGYSKNFCLAVQPLGRYVLHDITAFQ